MRSTLYISHDTIFLIHTVWHMWISNKINNIFPQIGVQRAKYCIQHYIRVHIQKNWKFHTRVALAKNVILRHFKSCSLNILHICMLCICNANLFHCTEQQRTYVCVCVWCAMQGGCVYARNGLPPSSKATRWSPFLENIVHFRQYSHVSLSILYTHTRHTYVNDTFDSIWLAYTYFTIYNKFLYINMYWICQLWEDINNECRSRFACAEFDFDIIRI